MYNRIRRRAKALSREASITPFSQKVSDEGGGGGALLETSNSVYYVVSGSKEPIFPCALHRTINTDNVGPNDNYHVRPLYDLKRELKIKCNRTAKNFVSVEFRNPVWQLDYKFSSRYPPNGSDDQVINGKRIKHLSANLINQYDDSFFTGFISSRQVRYQPDPYSRLKYYCAVTYYRQEDFDACQKKYLVPGG